MTRQNTGERHLHVHGILAILLLESSHGFRQMSLLNDCIVSQLSYCQVLLLDFSLQLSRPLYIKCQVAQLFLYE